MPVPLPVLDGLLSIGGKLIDRIFPDPAARDAAKLRLLELNQAGELEFLRADTQLALEQIKVNQAEASSPSLFKGGWRPFIGWTAGVGLAYQFIARPFLAWACGFDGATCLAPPALDLTDLIALVTGMLGLGGMRTTERLKGAIPRGL